MKTLFLILFLAFCTSAQPNWYPPEHQHPYWHIGLSTASQLSAYYLLHEKLGLSKDRSLLYSIPVGLIPGIVKELVDKRKNHYFNMEDMGYDTMGVTLGVSLVLTYNLHI